MSKALQACSYQLFDAVNIISQVYQCFLLSFFRHHTSNCLQTHVDPAAQFDMLNKAKGMRGATVLLQLSITQRNQALADKHIGLAAAARCLFSPTKIMRAFNRC